MPVNLNLKKVSPNFLAEEVALEMQDSSGNTAVCHLTKEQAAKLARDIQQTFPGYVPDQTVPIDVITNLVNALQQSIGDAEDHGFVLLTTKSDAKRAIEKAYGLLSIANPEAHAAYLQLVAAEEAHKQARQQFSALSRR